MAQCVISAARSASITTTGIDPIGKAQRNELTYANNDDEKRVSKFEDSPKAQTKNESLKRINEQYAEQI